MAATIPLLLGKVYKGTPENSSPVPWACTLINWIWTCLFMANLRYNGNKAVYFLTPSALYSLFFFPCSYALTLFYSSILNYNKYLWKQRKWQNPCLNAGLYSFCLLSTSYLFYIGNRIWNPKGTGNSVLCRNSHCWLWCLDFRPGQIYFIWPLVEVNKNVLRALGCKQWKWR